MDIRLIFRNRPRVVCTARCRLEEANGGCPAQAGRTRALIPGGSKGMTQHGSSSAFWLYASKPVGGVDRQIRPLSFNPEQRVKGAFASIRVSQAGKKSV
jgi:hypothetical protein